jgi:hypothetical protein
MPVGVAAALGGYGGDNDWQAGMVTARVAAEPESTHAA